MQCAALRTHGGPSRHAGRPLRAGPADQGRRGDAEGAEAAAPDLRDGHHRALPPAGSVRGGGADRDVPGRCFGAAGGGHHGSVVGHARVAVDGVGPQQEDLRDDRDLAQPPDRGRAPLCLSGRHRHEAELGGRGAQCLIAGGDCGERRGLPGDIGHLRGRQGGQGRLVGVPEALEGTRFDGRAPDHLRCLPWPGRERRRVLPRFGVAEVRRSLLPQCLQPCAEA